MSLTELMRNALVLARNVDMDVFNALNIMENDQVRSGLHLLSNLHYYSVTLG